MHLILICFLSVFVAVIFQGAMASAAQHLVKCIDRRNARTKGEKLVRRSVTIAITIIFIFSVWYSILEGHKQNACVNGYNTYTQACR